MRQKCAEGAGENGGALRGEHAQPGLATPRARLPRARVARASARMRRSPSREGDEGAEAKGWRRLAGVVQRDRAGPRGRGDFRFFGARWLPGAVQGSETSDKGSN